MREGDSLMELMDARDPFESKMANDKWQLAIGNWRLVSLVAKKRKKEE